MIEQAIDALKSGIEWLEETREDTKSRDKALSDILDLAGSIAEGDGSRTELDVLLTEIYEIAVTFG